MDAAALRCVTALYYPQSPHASAMRRRPPLRMAGIPSQLAALAWRLDGGCVARRAWQRHRRIRCQRRHLLTNFKMAFLSVMRSSITGSSSLDSLRGPGRTGNAAGAAAAASSDSSEFPPSGWQTLIKRSNVEI